jgi:hypothetical protein
MAPNKIIIFGSTVQEFIAVSYLACMEGQSSLPQEVDPSREIAFIILQSIFTNLRANAEFSIRFLL